MLDLFKKLISRVFDWIIDLSIIIIKNKNMRKSTMKKDVKPLVNKGGRRLKNNDIQETKKTKINSTDSQMLLTKRKNLDKNGVVRRPSILQKKLDELIGGNSDLPTERNNGPRLMQRSLTFCKGLTNYQSPNKPLKTKGSSRWYSSLRSLAEDILYKEDDEKNEKEQTEAIKSDGILQDQEATVSWEKKLASAPAYGRHSIYCDSSIDFDKLLPQPASSLPALAQSEIYEDEAGKKQARVLEKRGWSKWGSFGLKRGKSFMRLASSQSIDKQSSVRSRSLSQLDMLDASEQPLTGNASTHQQQHVSQQQHQLSQNRYHQQQTHQYSENQIDCSPRLLVPSVASVTDLSHTSNRGKHKLSRSQVSSSEYFSISFEVGEESGSLEREEFLPATKGTYLVEAVEAACKRRNVDSSRVDIYLDGFSSPLQILTTETSNLGGRHLRVTAKEDKTASRTSSQKSNQNVSLRKGGSYRGRSGGRFFSVSTEDSSMESSELVATGKSPSGTSSTGIKSSKQRWSGFFTSTKGTKMELLIEQLSSYTKHGVPPLPELPYDQIASKEDLCALEKDWRDIVQNWEHLSERQQQQQTALWEFAQTELAYIKTIQVVTNLFMACLCSLQSSNILNEVDKTKLFSNIPDIYATNRYFLTEHIIPMINATRDNGKPLDPGHLLHGFEIFEQTFSPYTRYCSDQPKCHQYCRDRFNDNELFTAYLVWCETQKDCNRLKLLDILIKPMQRLTKYSLLLKAIQKNTEDDDQNAELTVMIKCVDNFVVSVNAALHRTEEKARLANAATRLECYDVVESRDEELEKLIKSYSSLDITVAQMPGCPKDALRTLLREGDFKLRDTVTSKTEVHVLLMTDMLLLCKPSTKRGSASSSNSGNTGVSLKIIRQPYVVDRIRICELKESSSFGIVYLNEYGVASAAFVLTASEPKLAKSWMESLRKAQQQFAIMKIPPLGDVVPGIVGGSGVSRQVSSYGDGDYENEDSDVLPRTPRGSSRASRVSSLAHSHSGSMEMEGASPGGSCYLPSYNQSRNVSVDTNEPPRASSVSSEEGNETGSGHNHRHLQIRRSLLSKSPTPNTLSVQAPAYSSLGQSLPNLTLATSPQTSTVSATPPNSLLIVPQITKSKDTLLSPGHRGISYPPPSPPRVALRRAFAIPQSRNPPLIKTRHVNASVAPTTIQSTMSLDTETIEERRKRLDGVPRTATMSTTSLKEENRNEGNR